MLRRAVCEKCGKFIRDVTGPEFSKPDENGVIFEVFVTDSDKVDMETDYARRWITGIAPQKEPQV